LPEGARDLSQLEFLYLAAWRARQFRQNFKAFRHVLPRHALRFQIGGNIRQA
jgi:hypothetical protein